MLAVLGVLSPILDKVLGAFLPDPGKRQEVIMTILGQLQASDIAQLEVNKAEAQHESIFVAGWRPAIGWICAGALAYSYMIVPFVQFGLTLAGKPMLKLPVLDANLWELMFGMLGMGALRSYEKLKGIAK
jgi:hypothetical protein